MNRQGLPRRESLPWQRAAVTSLMTLCGFVILSAVVYWGFGWIKMVAIGITTIELPAYRPDKEWIFIPALVLLGLVVRGQRRRARAAT